MLTSPARAYLVWGGSIPPVLAKSGGHYSPRVSTESRRHLLLVNPSAGAGRVAELLPRARRALEASGVEYREVETTSLEHGCGEARAAAERGEVTIVMSGDGMIGQVGGALVETGATLALMPAGRGNDLARVLGIPDDPEGAAQLIAAGTTRAIDVGELNGKRFLGIASCGFDSDANRIANEARLVKGHLVYLYAALRALAAWKPARFTLTLDGRERVVVGYSAGACNNKAYGGGMYAAPDALLDDGLFDVLWVEQMSKLRFLTQCLPKVFKGTYVELPEVGMERAVSVRIEADRPFAVYADGDHLSDLPATLRVLPRALEIIAPPGPLVGPPA
jgi:YegS/Rv2252/BmrU family lipid kinase